MAKKKGKEKKKKKKEKESRKKSNKSEDDDDDTSNEPKVNVETIDGSGTNSKYGRLLLSIELPSDMYTVRITKLKDKPSVPDCAVLKEENVGISQNSDSNDVDLDVVKVEKLNVAEDLDCELIKVETPETNIVAISSSSSSSSDSEEEATTNVAYKSLSSSRLEYKQPSQTPSHVLSPSLSSQGHPRPFERGEDHIRMRVRAEKSSVDKSQVNNQRKALPVRIRHPPRQNVAYK